jgi:hypothetical protein
LDKFDEVEDEAGADDPEDYAAHSGPRRRWSDNGTGDE